MVYEARHLVLIRQGVIYKPRNSHPVIRTIPRETALCRGVIGLHVDLGMDRRRGDPCCVDRGGVALTQESAWDEEEVFVICGEEEEGIFNALLCIF
jgi:hypothetical protein